MYRKTEIISEKEQVLNTVLLPLSLSSIKLSDFIAYEKALQIRLLFIDKQNKKDIGYGEDKEVDKALLKLSIKVIEALNKNKKHNLSNWIKYIEDNYNEKHFLASFHFYQLRPLNNHIFDLLMRNKVLIIEDDFVFNYKGNELTLLEKNKGAFLDFPNVDIGYKRLKEYILAREAKFKNHREDKFYITILPYVLAFLFLDQTKVDQTPEKKFRAILEKNAKYWGDLPLVDAIQIMHYLKLLNTEREAWKNAISILSKLLK